MTKAQQLAIEFIGEHGYNAHAVGDNEVEFSLPYTFEGARGTIARGTDQVRVMATVRDVSLALGY